MPGCGAWPTEVHHLLSVGNKGRGVKASDADTIPLCGGPTGGHHRGSDSPHGWGNETAWAASHGFDPIATAAEFWRRSPAFREAA